MRFIKALFRSVEFRAYMAAYLGMFLGVWSLVTVLSSGYEYRLVDDEIKRAWMVKLPGYYEYTEMSDPPVTRRYFTMRAYYRVGPWIDPEWIDE